ncbi:MAG: hypothetical protein IPJ31_04480 [Bacteroidetes bacterium]|nr:hypothetical protein [Bacteroidota bacterium]
MLDSTHSRFDSLSRNHIDTLLHHWDQYTEDSATVLVFLKSYYYSGDSLADSTYKKNIETCFAQMQLVAKQFEKKKLACQVIMYDPCMLILKDDEEPFQKVELTLLEYY